jgi:predicted AAA+ superfamily ATPase
LTAFAERDLPALGFRLAPSRIRTLLTMLSHVHGNLLNQSDLARSLGVSVPTVQSHLDVLEGAFLVRRLPPHHANVQKRLTKSPKVFVRDSGLLHFLAGLRSTRDLENWPGRGRSFEGMVIEELIQQLSLRGNRPYFAFWRTQAGGEVDLLFDLGAGLIPVEIKLGPVDRYAVEGLRHCMQDLSIERGYVISNTAQESWQLGEDVTILPWAAIVAGKLPREWLRSRRM